MAGKSKVSPVREDVIAIACSDIHLSHKPPIARSAEPDWYEAMKRPLVQLQELSEKYNAPVIIAGDIFDKWNPPPELINFALEWLPENVYAIPGQHDLPFHSYSDIKKSGYWTLVQSGRISNLPHDRNYSIKSCVLYGSPWECAIQQVPLEDQDEINIAVVHAYIWKDGFSYPDAPKHSSLKSWSKQLLQFDCCIFGDNHKGFNGSNGVFNCGTLVRRKADEIGYEPQVGLITSNSEILTRPLDCFHDKFIDIDKALTMVEKGLELTDFIEELSALGGTALSFIDAVKEFVDKHDVAPAARELVYKMLEKK